jgi:hypothetical protein
MIDLLNWSDMAKRKRIRFEAFSIHGFVDGKPIAYEALCNGLAALRPEQRMALVGGKLVAVPKITKSEKKFFFTAYSGFKEATLLIYDTQTTEERVGTLPEGQLIARKVHGAIDVEKRLAFIEANRLGASPSQIAELFKFAAKQIEGFETLDLDFNPKAGESFKQALEEFGRIQSAKVQLSRPNINWTDFSNELTTFADDSNAHVLEVEGRAPRSKSLAKESGLISFVKSVTAMVHSPIKNAWVTGSIGNQKSLTTLNLNKHVESAVVEVPVAPSGGVSEQEVRESLAGLLDAGSKPKPG